MRPLRWIRLAFAFTYALAAVPVSYVAAFAAQAFVYGARDWSFERSLLLGVSINLIVLSSTFFLCSFVFGWIEDCADQRKGIR
jgi:hypothetical protein